MAQRRMRLKRGKDGDTGGGIITPPLPPPIEFKTGAPDTTDIRPGAKLHSLNVELKHAEFVEHNEVGGILFHVCTRPAEVTITLSGSGDPRSLLRLAEEKIYEGDADTTFTVRK